MIAVFGKGLEELRKLLKQVVSLSPLRTLSFVVRCLPKSSGSQVSREMLAAGAPLNFAEIKKKPLKSSGR